jgi:hypothetical protein
MAISAILGGLVTPPTPVPGQVQRLADPPEWVTEAWEQLLSSWGVPDVLKNPAPGVSKNVDPRTLEEALTAGDLTEVQEASKKIGDDDSQRLVAAEEVAADYGPFGGGIGAVGGRGAATGPPVIDPVRQAATFTMPGSGIRPGEGAGFGSFGGDPMITGASGLIPSGPWSEGWDTGDFDRSMGEEGALLPGQFEQALTPDQQFNLAGGEAVA